MVTFYLASLFPKIFDGVLDQSMLFKARNLKLIDIQLINIRDFGNGPRQQVDDTPYGGGDGMLLMVEQLYKLINHTKKISDKELKVILPSPRGKTYLQSDAISLASSDVNYLIVCPRYEGYDERITSYVDYIYSIGNYILTGGEIPAMVLVDSITRLIPGVLGGNESVQIESFMSDDQTKEFPQYTRPENFKDQKVPDVLLSGNHKKILEWRNKMMIGPEKDI